MKRKICVYRVLLLDEQKKSSFHKSADSLRILFDPRRRARDFRDR